MLHHINPDHISNLPYNLREILIQNAGLGIPYKNDPNQIHQFFTATILIDLINKYPNENFCIRSINYFGNGWDVIANFYIATDHELIIALWKAAVYTYDEEARRQKLAATKNWKPDDKELVTIKHFG